MSMLLLSVWETRFELWRDARWAPSPEPMGRGDGDNLVLLNASGQVLLGLGSW